MPSRKLHVPNDKDEFLPTMHGFDEFFGNLYHLNAVDYHVVAIAGLAELYPVAFFLRGENGEVLGGLFGLNIDRRDAPTEQSRCAK
jgi:hypothetical protein